MFPDRRTQAFVPLRVPNTPNGLPCSNVLALPRPGTSLEAGRQRRNSARRRSAESRVDEHGDVRPQRPRRVTATPLVDSLTGTVKTPLLVLLAAVALLLAAATANVANLQLARAMTRSRELALTRGPRRAGARESTGRCSSRTWILGLAGGAIGVVVAWALAPVVAGAAADRVSANGRTRSRGRRHRARAVARRRCQCRLHPHPRRRLAAPRSARGARRGRRRIGRRDAAVPRSAARDDSSWSPKSPSLACYSSAHPSSAAASWSCSMRTAVSIRRACSARTWRCRRLLSLRSGARQCSTKSSIASTPFPRRAARLSRPRRRSRRVGRPPRSI